MASSILLHELTRKEAGAVAPEALLVLPVGAIEQHGPHLPVGTDYLTVEYLAREAANQAQQEIPILIAPTLPFGSSHHHLSFGGTMSLSTETYYRTLLDLGESMIISGFRSLVLLNGHGGNHELIQLVARDLAIKHKIKFAAMSYWTVAWDALIEVGAHKQSNLPGHAGSFETSEIMALRPELVREPRPHRDGVTDSDPQSFYTAYRDERHQWLEKINGYTDSPDQGDAERGKTYLAAIIKSVSQAFVKFHKSGN